MTLAKYQIHLEVSDEHTQAELEWMRRALQLLQLPAVLWRAVVSGTEGHPDLCRVRIRVDE